MPRGTAGQVSEHGGCLPRWGVVSSRLKLRFLLWIRGVVDAGREIAKIDKVAYCLDFWKKRCKIGVIT